MREEYFVNIAFDQAIKLYLNTRANPNSLNYNSFLVIVIRILVLIYGEADILNPYYLKNNVAFLNNLSKYGLSKSDVAILKSDFLSYYNFESENVKRTIKLKNPYFTNILKILVDMFILKKQNYHVNYYEEEEFLDLAYTSHTTNPLQVSYNYLVSDDPKYIEKYYYSKINSLDVTKDLSNTINMNLNLEALKYVGVNLTNLPNLSDQDLINAQKRAYNYFEVDATKPNRDEQLQTNLEYLKNYGKKKITTGNGYVDILLLMSVIATSFSIFTIIIFSL